MSDIVKYYAHENDISITEATNRLLSIGIAREFNLPEEIRIKLTKEEPPKPKHEKRKRKESILDTIIRYLESQSGPG